MDTYEYERAEAKRKVREGLARGMADFCAATAASQMVVGLFHPDPEIAAQRMAESMRWQYAGIVAGLGDPELVTKFLGMTHEGASA